MNCEECGSPLVRVLGEETITTLDGATVLFRRRTDYLLCRACLRLYSIVQLRQQKQLEHVGDVTDLSYFSVLAEESTVTAEDFVERRVADENGELLSLEGEPEQ